MEITLTFEKLILLCGGFSAICVAGGWLIKIVDALKKPSKETKKNIHNIDDRLGHYKERIEDLESTRQNFADSIALMLKVDLALLNHLRTDNNTGVMAKLEEDIQEFLLNGGLGKDFETGGK